jgi:hypothetical protein
MLTLVPFLPFVSAFLCATIVSGQQFDLSWYTIESGGGRATGGKFELEGTIGQHDAGTTMTGGSFALSGGFWVGMNNPGPFTVTPDSVQVTRGQYVSGNETTLAVSDNNDLSLRRLDSDIQSRTEFVVKGYSPIAPESLKFKLEGAVFARSNVVQTIELFDYVANRWEILDSRNATRSPAPDLVVTVAATGDLSRFVEAETSCMEARVRYKSDIPRQNFASNTDQTVWMIE